MAYQKAVIAIPNVIGNIVINVTTSTAVPNLFTAANSVYNSRLASNGAPESEGSLAGGLVTNLIPIDSSMSALHITGVTEEKNTAYNYFLRVVAYQSDGTTRESHVNYASSAIYEYDVAGLLASHPNAKYIRFGIILKDGVSISQSDTDNLVIYSS